MTSAPSSGALERKERLEHIQNMNLKASDMKDALYDKDELETLNISVEPFTLAQNGMPTFSPCFFQPFGGDIKEDPYVEELDDDSRQWLPCNEAYDKPPWVWAQRTFDFWADHMFTQAYEYKKRTNSEFPAITCRSYASSRSSLFPVMPLTC